MRSRVFWILVVVLFCSSIAQNGAITHISALLTDRGLSAGGRRPGHLRDGRARASAGRLVTGWLLDRFFAARVSFALLAARGARHVRALRGGRRSRPACWPPR